MALVPRTFNYFEHMRARGTSRAPVETVKEPSYETIDFPGITVTETETTEEEITLLRQLIEKKRQLGDIRLVD